MYILLIITFVSFGVMHYAMYLQYSYSHTEEVKSLCMNGPKCMFLLCITIMSQSLVVMLIYVHK